MASFRTVGRKYVIRFYDRSRNPKEVTFSLSASLFTEQQARKKMRRWEVLCELGEWDPWTRRLPAEGPARRELTLLEAVERYCTHKAALGSRGQKGGWNATTHRDYRYVLLDFAGRIDRARLVNRLSAKDFEAYLFDKTVAEATRAKRRRMLTTFLRWLAGEGLVETAIPMPRPFLERRRLPEYFTEAEMEAVCAAHELICREDAAKPHVPKRGRNSPLALLWMSAAWRFAFYQGLRRGELLAMRAGAVDLSRSRMAVGDKHFVPKGRDERIITITPPARTVVEPYLREKKPQDLVLPGCQPDRLGKRFKRALRRAIEDGTVAEEKSALHMHDLRASCCNYWLNEPDVPLERVQELLRHKSIRTTERFYRSTNVEAQTRVFSNAWQMTAEGSMQGAKKVDFEKVAGKVLV